MSFLSDIQNNDQIIRKKWTSEPILSKRSDINKRLLPQKKFKRFDSAEYLMEKYEQKKQKRQE
ncbi:hypothetical protein ENUP19_0163G0009 [Entamoeba nuttalli]|uniref:Uncharacterized protein n=1 Tax=Entamoeba nuttalli TaxID=412467 RepID=A0ABQ0DLX2_9EUKA